MPAGKKKTAVITGASSGIGAATAHRLAADGFHVVLGARRAERVAEVAAACHGDFFILDVTDRSSVEKFASSIEEAHVLVNNAGLASGVEPVAGLSEERVRTMWETNVMGLIRMTQALLPLLEASGDGHVVNVGSIAGFETYRGGGGYTASKHAVRALTRTLRLELLGKPIRVTEVAPGLVETEFSLVRFDGDADKATRPYAGLEPLTADDIADCISWAVTRPNHVNIDEIIVRPISQATATEIVRQED
jgi:NADP-dependent 3-hydroxy acid dehydrogenase YdfG